MSDEEAKLRWKALEAALASNDNETITNAIAAHFMGKHPESELTEALKSSEWRFVITGSGTSLKAERRDAMLAYYRELLDQVAEAVPELIIVEGSDAVFSQLELRDSVGKNCMEAACEATRVRRFLLPGDDAPDIHRDLDKCLAGTGLKWNGRYQLEREPGEYDALFDAGLEIVKSRSQASARF